MAQQPVKSWQVLRDVNWVRITSSGQMVGHPVSPNNPNSDYRQGDVITGREVSVPYIDVSGMSPKKVVGQFIQISQNGYVHRKAVATHSGNKPVGGHGNFHGAEGSSIKKNWQILKATNWFWYNAKNNSIISHPVDIANPNKDFGQGQVIRGIETEIKTGKGGVPMKVIHIDSNRYVRREYVAPHNAGAGNVGAKERKCRRINPDGTITAYDCPESKSSFSGSEAISKINSGVITGGITFGVLGGSIGVLLGSNAKSVIGFAGAGVVLGALVGSTAK